MFRALADAAVNVRMISTSEVCISTVVELTRGDEALNALVAAFGLQNSQR
jgi:aspartokinase